MLQACFPEVVSWTQIHAFQGKGRALAVLTSMCCWRLQVSCHEG